MEGATKPSLRVRLKRGCLYLNFLLLLEQRRLLLVSTFFFTSVLASVWMFKSVQASGLTVSPSNLLPGSIPTTTCCLYLVRGGRWRIIQKTPLYQYGFTSLRSSIFLALFSEQGIRGFLFESNTGITSLLFKMFYVLTHLVLILHRQCCYRRG